MFSPLLNVPVTTEVGALAFLQALVDADKSYHLEDGAHDIMNFQTGERCFTPDEAKLVDARVGEIYDLPLWTSEDCPIGRMMEMQARKHGFNSWQEWMDA